LVDLYCSKAQLPFLFYLNVYFPLFVHHQTNLDGDIRILDLWISDR
jgi:hypothetical protein